MQWVWGRDAHAFTLPTTRWSYRVGDVRVNWTQIIGVAFPIVVTAGTAVFLRVTKVGTAMRALANDREITAMLGVPVRRVEAAAWFGSGLVCGIAGLLLANLVGLDIVGVTFLVIPALAAALIGQLSSLWVTLAAGFVIGIVQSSLTAFTDVHIGEQSLADYRSHHAVRPGHHRPALVRPEATAGADVSGRPRSRICAPEETAPAPPIASARETLTNPVRLAVIVGLFVFVMFGLPALLDSYWMQVITGVVIYSIMTLGLGLLIGRVGLVSLCQFVLAAIGAWVALRLSFATDLPFPVLHPHRGRRHRRHRHAHRSPGAAAVRTLPRADHADGRRRDHRRPAHRPVPERRWRVLRQHGRRRCVVPPAPAVDRHERHRLLPLLRRRRRA